jgi:hypothetical protein
MHGSFKAFKHISDKSDRMFFILFAKNMFMNSAKSCIYCYENFAFQKLFNLLPKVFIFVLSRICSGFINIFREYSEKISF